jgi:hypothetical protein
MYRTGLAKRGTKRTVAIRKALRSLCAFCPFRQVVIMVHIVSAPTVDLFVFVPGPLGAGSWAWTDHPRWPGVLASEYCYSAREAVALVRAYAVTMGRLVTPREAPRFTVLARGRTTGLVVARDEWEWHQRAHAFEPTDEPWCTWKQVARRYYEVTGVRIESRCFRARFE